MHTCELNLSFLWALAFEYPVINSPFLLKRNYSFLHPHGGVYCREARPSQCRQNWLSQFSDFAKHCLIEYDENSYTCTCFLSSQCPRKIVTLGWLRFLEGLAKHLDICYLGRGTWLMRTNLSNLGLSGLRLRPFSLGPRSSCWPCPPRSLAFFFGGIFTSLTDFILKFWNFIYC